MKIRIEKYYYEKLINDSIESFDSEEMTFNHFYNFLKRNNFLLKTNNQDTICLSNQFYVDDNDKTYDNLVNSIKQFFFCITNNTVEDPNQTAEYLLKYLYIVFYRAFIKVYNVNYIDKYSFGLSIEKAYSYMFYNTGATSSLKIKGIIEDYYDFCIKNNLTNYYINASLHDKSLEYLFFTAQSNSNVEKFISSMDDISFYTICASFQNIGGFLDYRLISMETLKFIDYIKNNQSEIDPNVYKQLSGVLNLEKELKKMIMDNEHISLLNFYEKELSSIVYDLTALLSKHLKINKSFINEQMYSILLDISQYGPKKYINSINTSKTQKKLQMMYSDIFDGVIYSSTKFEEILQKEQTRRSQLLYDKLRLDGSKITSDKKVIKDYVMRFLKSAKKAGYNYLTQFSMDEEVFEKIYNKITNNQETLEILAGFQKRFEEVLDNGLRYNDYTYLLCGPIKIIEKIFKLELYKHYNDKAYKIKNFRQTDSLLQFVEGKIYNDPMNNLVLSLQNAINLSNKQMPWFLVDNRENRIINCDCYLYQAFINKVRNGYFHTDIIQSLSDGKKLYYKVAFWLVQCLIAFNPY